MTEKKRGRPRGLALNPAAVEHFLVVAGMSRTDLCGAANITKSFLSEALDRTKGKGVGEDTVHRIAEALDVPVGIIAPELSASVVAIRTSDRSCDVPVRQWLAAVLPRSVAGAS